MAIFSFAPLKKTTCCSLAFMSCSFCARAQVRTFILVNVITEYSFQILFFFLPLVAQATEPWTTLSPVTYSATTTTTRETTTAPTTEGNTECD